MIARGPAGQCGLRSIFGSFLSSIAVLLLFGASASPALAKSPKVPPPSGSVIPFAGQIQNVGSGKDNGVLQLSGKVRGASLDLSTATLWLTHLLYEGKGAKELVRDGGPDPKLVPLFLTARKGSSPSAAVFESAAAPGVGPQVQVTVTQSSTSPNDYDFTIKVQGALIASPQSCANAASGMTQLRTRFALRDGLRRARFYTKQNWQCTKNRLGNPFPADNVSAGLTDSGTPEGLVTSMATDLALDIASDELTSLLFPSDYIDYQQLIDDFAQVVQQELDQNDIDRDENNVNGFLQDFNDWQSDYDNGHGPLTAQETLSLSNGQENAINIMMSQLEGDGLAGLSGWVAGAQTHLNYLQFEQGLSYVANPSDLSWNKLLANYLDQYLQHLVAQRGALLNQNIVGSLHYCYTYSPTGASSLDQYAFKNCTGATHDGFQYRSSCEISALATENTGCAQKTLDDQTNEIAWIDQVIAQWRTALANMATGTTPDGRPLLPPDAVPCATCQDAYAAITIDESTDHMLTTVRDDGGDSDTTPPIDTTAWIKGACDSNQSCDFQIESKTFVQSVETPSEIHAVSVSYHCGSDTLQRTASLTDVGSPNAALYDGAYLHLDCAPRVTNFQVSVQNKAVGALDVDASTDTQRPDAGKITSNKYAPAGTSATDPSWAIVLPHNGAYGALTVDLGATVNVCGNGFDCASGPSIQADNDDHYELDYSTDGVHWTTYGQFKTASDEGLQTRGMLACTQTNGPPCNASGHGASFSARYVRVFAVSGGNTFSVSQLELWNTGSQPVSIGKPAWGPEPLITNGQYANEGESWDDSVYVTKLSAVGPANALVIDLAGIQGTLDRVKVQAHGNGAYQVDVSTDGAVWWNWYSVPPTANAGGLRTRDSGPLPPAAGRYARIYATHGNDFSVSEVQFFADQAAPTCNGQRVCGASAATLLEDFAGAGSQDVKATWTCGNDPSPYTAQGVPWTVTRSGVSYPDSAVLQARCPTTTVTCTDPGNNPTTCSNFAKDADDTVVYANAAKIPFQLSATYSSCSSVIGGKTNYYHQQGSTANNPACQNVQNAIHDAIAEGSCPAATGSDANNSWKLWPYNVGVGAGTTSTTVVDPAVGQPPLLLFLGCNSLLQ